MLSPTEENYLKSIFKIAEKENKAVSTNSIANLMSTTPASVTDMIQKLSQKKYLQYTKYKGVTLTQSGNKVAIKIIRKARLWEVFLVNKLRFAWHQIHNIADELEHVSSDELISRLDAFLDYPKFDPHGNPVPNADGKFTIRNQMALADIPLNQKVTVLGVKENLPDFLRYLTDINIRIGVEIMVLQQVPYDKSMRILIDNKTEQVISRSTSKLLSVKLT
ncbi:MAG: metal-dependent transcriptional regulator [Saprospiraceae bacterium]|jgi:DtxR family Mn-dependent transcriptional regulator|nr:metal-dependent transcriptional regulator [Saprospiraceae bacterium]